MLIFVYIIINQLKRYYLPLIKLLININELTFNIAVKNITIFYK